ncbi:cell division protein ZipA C-terminal FtsZ-binding domain-containing protein [Azovibrio restrictus]|uniref:cell division protein ZipA C-terminal FtsZ-binding domain-containing protein n=1 Tax=Azovibrio restrictus TaxID=146938 RepID=UPI0026EF1D6E|nr:cell division protein ZipA C-terminal FtsZ-binding domain-containing protein [Azovibrio restrictus]MDD3483702.1 cell division protein ZipA C-terminal FtsZ-binding domain-containing protein [Azovibrio restrictus]
MSELQMGVLALGGVGVLLVFAYNKWQEYQHRKVAERVFQQPDEDVLLERRAAEPVWQDEEAVPGDSRREPGLNRVEDEDDEWARHEAEQAAAAQAAEPVESWESAAEPLSGSEAPADLLPPWEEESAAAPAPPAQDVPMPTTLLSPAVDAIAILELVEHVPASQVMASQREALRRLRKPLHWVGFNEAQGEWEFIQPDSPGAYRRLRVGLQLADRQGPVSSGDFSLFSGAMQQLADELMAVVDMPSSQQALDQAQQLDRFCAEVDMQIGVNLVSRGTPFAGTKIRALAEAAGMTLGMDGCYTRRDDDGRVLFSLQNFEASGFAADTLKSMSTHGLVFLLDVPRTPRGQHVYTQMVDITKRFAEALNGALVDDNRQPLAEPQLAHIRQEYVQKPQVFMESQGLPAGGSLALRLFS